MKDNNLGGNIMKQETTKKEIDMKKVGLAVAATVGTIGTISLGVMCYLKTKDNKQLMKINVQLKLDKEIYKSAYDELVYQAHKTSEDISIVKQVVGGPLINRLIKNEEKTLSRFTNKIKDISAKGLDETAKAVVKDYEERSRNCMETIADFIQVKDILNK